MRYIVALLGCLTIASSAYAQGADDSMFALKEQGIGANAAFFSDSEGFKARKLGAGVYPWYEYGDRYAGVRVTHHAFSQNGWSSDGMQYSLAAKQISTRTGMGYNVDVGHSTQGSHSLVTTDSSWSHRWSERTATEAFINRDWVESQNALTDGVSHTFVGGSVEQQLVKRVTVVGLLGGQAFSDGNTRPHARARLVYDLWPEYGLTLQGRYRVYSSSQNDVNGHYFNPENYSEEMIALGIRRRFDGWMFNGTAGLGQEHVDSAPAANTRLVALELNSPMVGSMFFRTKAGYNQAAGVNGPSYSARYVQGEFVFRY